MTREQMKAMLASYLRHFFAAVLAGIIAVGGGRIPLDFTADEWYAVANAVWIALIPVAQRWLSSDDRSFGRGAAS